MDKLLSERHYAERIGWLRAAVLGANDGIVSTASLVVGVAAASAPGGGVLIAGIAGLVAGAMSMAAGEYVSVSSQADTEKSAVFPDPHRGGKLPNVPGSHGGLGRPGGRVGCVRRRRSGDHMGGRGHGGHRGRRFPIRDRGLIAGGRPASPITDDPDRLTIIPQIVIGRNGRHKSLRYRAI